MARFTTIDELDDVDGLTVSERDIPSAEMISITEVHYRGRDFVVTLSRLDPTNDWENVNTIVETTGDAPAEWPSDEQVYDTDEAAFLAAVEAIIGTVDDDEAGYFDVEAPDRSPFEQAARA